MIWGLALMLCSTASAPPPVVCPQTGCRYATEPRSKAARRHSYGPQAGFVRSWAHTILRGQVVDAATGYPVPGAHVLATGPSVPPIDYLARPQPNETYTDVHGRFIFPEFGRGDYAISVWAHRFAPYFRATATVDGPLEIELQSGQYWTVRIVGADLARRASLIRLSRIDSNQNLGEVRALANGGYLTPALLPGRYRLSASGGHRFPGSHRFLSILTLGPGYEPVVTLPSGQSRLRVMTTTTGTDAPRSRTTVELTAPDRDHPGLQTICSVGPAPCVFEHLECGRYSVALVVADPVFGATTIARAEVVVPSQGTVSLTLAPHAVRNEKADP